MKRDLRNTVDQNLFSFLTAQLLRMVHVEILLNFGNYFRTSQLGF